MKKILNVAIRNGEVVKAHEIDENSYLLRFTYSSDGDVSCIEQLSNKQPIVTLTSKELEKQLSDSQRKAVDIELESGFSINPILRLKRILELANQSGCLSAS